MLDDQQARGMKNEERRGERRSPARAPARSPAHPRPGSYSLLRSWWRRVLRKIDIPLRHEVRRPLSSHMRMKLAAGHNGTTLRFLDRCRILGLAHELRWYWVKAVASEHWRQLAGRYRWIFILGCNNSGTTLLARLLESHPAIIGVPRGGRGATVALLRPRQAQAIRLWTEKLELFRLTEADHHPDALRLIYDWVSAVRESNRLFVLEKAPPDMVCARWLQSVFPHSYFIGLVRNGYAVAEGMRRREGYSLDRCARHWNTANKIMMEDAAYLQRFMLVRYEELTNDPLDTIRRVCQFLDLDDTPLQAVVDKEWNVHNMDNTPAKIQDFNLRSLERLSPNDIEIINRYAGEMLARLGYVITWP